MLSPLYSFNLNQQIQEGLVTLAKFDGVKPNLVCATVGGKVFVHTPHDTKLEGNVSSDIKYLNTNKNICSIGAGTFDPSNPKECLAMASQNSLIAYDVEKNSDIFYKEITDGVNMVTFGILNNTNKSLLFVGGNCSIQGFDRAAEEQFWTVTGDNVSTIAFCDIDDDGYPEMLVGSDDFVIRAFKQEEILFEINEAAKISQLCPIRDTYFAFALDNGTVGVYNRKQRLWKVKTKFKVVSLVGIDVEGESIYCLIVGWNNGRVEVRSDVSGEVLFKIQLSSPLAKILKGDYRNDGTVQIIVITTDGQVKGYSFNYNLRGLTQDNAGPTQAAKQNEVLFAELTKKKNDLMAEYKMLSENKPSAKKADAASLVPYNTKVGTAFRHNMNKKIPELIFQTNNTSVIRSVIVFADQIFTNESCVCTPTNPSNTLAFPLKVTKHVSVNFNIRALVGNSGNSTQYQVYEMQKRLPKFCNFVMVKSTSQHGVQLPTSNLTFYIKERIPRFVKWLDQGFILPEGTVDQLEKQDHIDVQFVDLSDQKSMQFIFAGHTEGKIIIKSDSLETAGDMVQDLCSFMNIQELESVADFPVEMEELKSVIKKVNDFNEVRLHLTADMAESVRNAKTFIVRAEDARILGDMKNMKKYYSNMYVENRNLIAELMKRNTNHEGLLAGLKQINNMISKASNLRMGQPKTKLVSLCRNAIKNNNIFSLLQIIQSGKDA
jgi:Bardet-Biedl syndrome 2 protein